MYISRASGNDSWSCDQIKPCKTLWRTVTLASRGDHLHLDGTNTEKDPYTCQSGTLTHPGIYIDKSVSLIGFGPMPPHVRCSEENKVTFDGSYNAHQVNITLLGLILSDSSLYFQDSSVSIDSCKFEGNKRGVQFLISTRMVSSIQITNSTFVGNEECISVILNSIKNLSHQRNQVIFELKNSSFYGNTISDKKSCISFRESNENKQCVSCNITLENVTFSYNYFSSRGLVFLELENGNQDIELQNVTFINNRQSLGYGVLRRYNQSVFIVRSNLIIISINASNFTSQNARSFSISASTLSLQIQNSRFRDHQVEGKGGVISIRGAELCKMNVSNSSFLNTTADQGGAFNVECAKVRFCLHNCSFTENMAMHGSGGAVSIDALDSGLNNSECATDGKPSSTNKSEEQLQLVFTKCRFVHAYSFSRGGSIHINASKNDLLLTVENSRFLLCKSDGDGGSLSVLYERKIQINIKNSHFISNYAHRNGGGLYVDCPVLSDKHWKINTSYSKVENSTFLYNSADSGGAMSVLGNKRNTVILHEVTMESNRARDVGGVAYIIYIFAFKIRRSRFSKNTAGGLGGVLHNLHVYRFEVQDSLFEDNYVGRNRSGFSVSSGGAFYLTYFTGSISFITISIINTTFRNCSAQWEGGAIKLIHDGKNVCLVVQRSLFVENHSFQHHQGSTSTGGAVFLDLQRATEKVPGCNVASQKEDEKNFSSWNCKNGPRFEDVRFVRNTGDAGGAIYLNAGKATFENCYFADNFASSQGGHIRTAYGNASLAIKGCLFLQAVKELLLGTMNYSTTSFVHSESSGKLSISNTTMDVRAYGCGNPLMLITNGRLIDVGNDDNLTKFYCPVGSQMDVVKFKIGVQYLPETLVSTLEFRCSTCEGNSYSLQRGLAIGSHVVTGFQCLPCPFGANCTQNILAKRNFWGFQEQNNPPTLQFIMCPVGYCGPPRETTFSEYNSCQGNRSGELCGRCSENYTETLYSTHCRPSNQCEDYWFWPVALIYVSFMALYFTLKPPIAPWLKRQILWFKETEPDGQDNDFDKGYLKILFYFYQAANLLLISSTSQEFIKTNFIEPIVGVFNFKVFNTPLSCPFSGLTVVTKQLFSAFHVFGILLMICAFYILHRGIQKIRGQGVPSAGPYIGGILQTLLLGYTTLATVSFSLLRCVPIGSERRLFYDGNVVCFQWWQCILITFVCIYVLPFVFVLLWGSYKLYNEILTVENFLLACFFPLPSIIYWLFLSFSRALGYPVIVHLYPSQASKHFVEMVLYDPFKQPEHGRTLSLSWESIMIGRRLILVIMKTFVHDPLPRLLILSLFCFLFLLQHVLVQPFRDRLANTVETISLLSIAVIATGNVFFASFLSLSVAPNDHLSSWCNILHGVETVILCLVPVGLGLLVVAAIVSQLCRLAVVVCHVMWTFCCTCFRSCSINKKDEAKPLLGN